MSCPPAAVERVRLVLAPTHTEWGTSRWGEWRRCRKAHHLRHVLNIEPARPDPDDLSEESADIDYFALGSLVHACLAYVQLGAILGEQRDWQEVIDGAATLVIPDRDLSPAQLCREAERLVGAYFAHYGIENGGWPEEFEIVGVEVPLEQQIGVGVVTTRADTILRMHSTGQYVVADTKTRKAAFPTSRDEFRISQRTNPQFLATSHMVQKHFALEEPPAVWINGIIKTKVPKFDRMLVPFQQRHVDQWVGAQALDSERMVSESQDAMNYSACAPPFGSRCWAFGWCHGSDELRASKYVKKVS